MAASSNLADTMSWRWMLSRTASSAADMLASRRLSSTVSRARLRSASGVRVTSLALVSAGALCIEPGINVYAARPSTQTNAVAISPLVLPDMVEYVDVRTAEGEAIAPHDGQISASRSTGSPQRRHIGLTFKLAFMAHSRTEFREATCRSAAWTR